ncbi:MAG: AsmA family protein, partial [Gemmatimonadetes bacterium]|nr:AsmA family protein [Gemmatimonadota bacterium]
MDQTEHSPDVRLPVSGPTDRSAGRGRKTAGRIALVLGVLLALVLAVVLVFAVRFRSLLDPETLADRLEPRISQAVNRPVTIEGAELRLWPRPGVVVEGIRIANRGMFSETALATADAVVLEPRLLPLLRRQIVVDRIVVRSPRALLVVAEDGTSNFGDFVPERSETDGAGAGLPGLSLDIKRVELVDGRVGYRDAMRSRSLQLDGVNLRTDLDASGAGSIGTEGTASAEQVIVRLPEAPGNSIETGEASIEWSGRVAGDLDSFELDRGALEAGPFRAR